MRSNAAVIGPVEAFEWPETPKDLTRRAFEGWAGETAFLLPAETDQFVAWMWEIGEREISIFQLSALYTEYCCHAGRSPLRLSTLQRRLRNAGVVPFKGKTERTVYRILPRRRP